MKKVRSHHGSQQVDLSPPQRSCPGCGHSLAERYRQGRYGVTLTGMLRLNKHVLECQTPECPHQGTKWQPEREGALVLPYYTFGLEVVARIGERRYRQQQTVNQIASELRHSIGQLKKDRRRVTGRKETGRFILREGRAVAVLHSLPSHPNWLEAFAAVDIEHFQKSLAELRRADQRRQAWQVRRDLQVYLSHLEKDWKPPP